MEYECQEGDYWNKHPRNLAASAEFGIFVEEFKVKGNEGTFRKPERNVDEE